MTESYTHGRRRSTQGQWVRSDHRRVFEEQCPLSRWSLERTDTRDCCAPAFRPTSLCTAASRGACDGNSH